MSSITETGGKAIDTIVGILVAVVGVAILAAIVYQGSQTPQVFDFAGRALAGILNAALISTE